jgi:hypothetical protein
MAEHWPQLHCSTICCWLAGVDSQTNTDSNQNTQGKRISCAKLLMFEESCGSFESNPAFVLHLRSQTKAYLCTLPSSAQPDHSVALPGHHHHSSFSLCAGMAAAALAVAKEVGTVALPLLVDKCRGRGRVAEDVQAIVPTVAKCSELLMNLRPDQLEPLATHIRALQTALGDANTLLQTLAQAGGNAEPEQQDPEQSMLSKGLGIAKSVVSGAVSATQDMMRADGRHRQLSEMNEGLLRVSLDLSLAASRIPPPKKKTSVCTVQ